MNSSFLVLVICILIVGSTIWSNSPASSDEMESLISRVNSSHSEEVKTKLIHFLKETPNPTRQQLSDFKETVEQHLVVDLARQATGDQSLQAKVIEEVKAETPQRAQTFAERLIIWLVVLASGFFLVKTGYDFFKRRKNGQS